MLRRGRDGPNVIFGDAVKQHLDCRMIDGQCIRHLRHSGHLAKASDQAFEDKGQMRNVMILEFPGFNPLPQQMLIECQAFLDDLGNPLRGIFRCGLIVRDEFIQRLGEGMVQIVPYQLLCHPEQLIGGRGKLMLLAVPLLQPFHSSIRCRNRPSLLLK